MIKEGLSVRELEELVRKYLKNPTARKQAPAQTELPSEYTKMLSHIGKFFSNDISVRRSASGKGTMTVKFASDEEVQRFLEALEKADI